MKLLIMEDEVQTREGLASDVPWKKYGIGEVFTAKNGELGLETAKRERPDIILTDIRMPRLDGISAVKKLRGILPRCSIIFISAYPEKNYFKEAIRLKAVSFVEKPINMKELDEVVREAVQEQCRALLQEKQEEKAALYSREQLVQRLSRGRFLNREECLAALAEVGIDAAACSCFVTILVKYVKNQDKEDENRWSLFCLRASSEANKAPERLLGGQKDSDVYVFHAFLKREQKLQRVLEWLKESLSDIRRFYVLAGSLQKSVMKFQESYNDAVLLANTAFYRPYGEILCGDFGDILMSMDFGTWKAEFTETLRRKQFGRLLELLEKFRDGILKNSRIHYTVIREFYLYLFGELDRYIEQNAVYIQDIHTGNLTQEFFLQSGNYGELHEGIVKMIQMLSASANSDEDELIVRIKKYVSGNYQNPWLSIKEISDAVGRSVSYTCVIFKKETGVTLNQFLTDMRMEAARILLDNPRNSIRAVAEQCGYTDSSYFARTFKKYVGQTPSEYRGEGK